MHSKRFGAPTPMTMVSIALVGMLGAVAIVVLRLTSEPARA